MTSNLKSAPDWWEVFRTQNPVPQKSLDHFASIAWTESYLRNPHYEPVPVFSRTVKPDGEDYFFATTINTKDTIPHYVCLLRKDLGNIVPPGPRPDDVAVKGRKEVATPPEVPDSIYLLSIAKAGLDGHPGVLHGGMSCAILDETIGNMIMLHIHNIEGPVRKSHCFTIYLNTVYRAQVPTGEELVVRTWLVHKDGRKWLAMGQLIDKKGTVCTEAECLYLIFPMQKL